MMDINKLHAAVEAAGLNAILRKEVLELIERLRAAEKERDECNRRRLEAADHFAAQTALMKQKYDDLRVKVAEMERQEPVGKFVQHPSNGLWEQDGYGDNPDANPLYALPGAQSVPDVDALAQLIREIDGKHQLGAGALAERIVEWLAAAPEAKPCGAQIGASVPVAALRPVIDWLRNGCDPMKAADELEMLTAAPEAKK